MSERILNPDIWIDNWEDDMAEAFRSNLTETYREVVPVRTGRARRSLRFRGDTVMAQASAGHGLTYVRKRGRIGISAYFKNYVLLHNTHPRWLGWWDKVRDKTEEGVRANMGLLLSQAWRREGPR